MSIQEDFFFKSVGTHLEGLYLKKYYITCRGELKKIESKLVLNGCTRVWEVYTYFLEWSSECTHLKNELQRACEEVSQFLGHGSNRPISNKGSAPPPNQQCWIRPSADDRAPRRGRDRCLRWQAVLLSGCTCKPLNF